MAKENIKLNKLIEAAIMIRGIKTKDADELAFMARMLVQATLPHSDPGEVVAWGRQNGNFSLTISPGTRMIEGKPKSIGLPYGSYPRLVLAWITTEAVKTKSARIVLGDSLTSFMGELGLVPTGGRWGSITRLREQMKRLFASRISAVYEGDNNFQQHSMEIATDIDLWWSPKHPDQAAIFESSIILGDRFFRAITERPIPIDMRVLKALKRSPLGLDLYSWLTYRVSYLNEKTEIAWTQLHEQFGADYADTRDFTKKVKRELKKISFVWPELRYETPRGRLVLKKSHPHVTRLQ